MAGPESKRENVPDVTVNVRNDQPPPSNLASILAMWNTDLSGRPLSGLLDDQLYGGSEASNSPDYSAHNPRQDAAMLIDRASQRVGIPSEVTFKYLEVQHPQMDAVTAQSVIADLQNTAWGRQILHDMPELRTGYDPHNIQMNAVLEAAHLRMRLEAMGYRAGADGRIHLTAAQTQEAETRMYLEDTLGHDRGKKAWEDYKKNPHATLASLGINNPNLHGPTIGDSVTDIEGRFSAVDADVAGLIRLARTPLPQPPPGVPFRPPEPGDHRPVMASMPTYSQAYWDSLPASVRATLASTAAHVGITRYLHCWDWAEQVYNGAGVTRHDIVRPQNVSGTSHDFKTSGRYSFDTNRRYMGLLRPGDWIFINNRNGADTHGDHSGVFVGWQWDPKNHKWLALVASGPNPGHPANVRAFDLDDMPITDIARAGGPGVNGAPLTADRNNPYAQYAGVPVDNSPPATTSAPPVTQPVTPVAAKPARPLVPVAARYPPRTRDLKVASAANDHTPTVKPAGKPPVHKASSGSGFPDIFGLSSLFG